MKRVLILAETYIPGIKGGGPIQSIKNLTDALGQDIEFYILTADRDIGDENQYPDIDNESTYHIGRAKVRYLNIKKTGIKEISTIINKIQPDVLYLNSYFSFKFSIIPIILNYIKMIHIQRVVLAPRGEFSPGALGLKKNKKKIYVSFANLIGIYRNVIWHATGESEEKDIKNNIIHPSDIVSVSNFTADYNSVSYSKAISKKPGKVKLAFLSRIHPKKNLSKSLELLNNVTGEIELNIYGPIEDEVYWNECKKVINSLSDNISVNYLGLINHENVITVFKNHHFFYFLTLGENFGHVIAESLIAGTPVIISNQTPWRSLEKKGVGWDLNLKNQNKIKEILHKVVNMNEEEYEVMSKEAFKFSKKELDLVKKRELMLDLLLGDRDEE